MKMSEKLAKAERVLKRISKQKMMTAGSFNEPTATAKLAKKYFIQTNKKKKS